MTEDEKLNETAERVSFLASVGLDPTGSVASQLAETRLLLGRMKLHEAELERWARSGDFVLAVPGEPVSVVVNSDGAVLVVHNGEKT